MSFSDLEISCGTMFDTATSLLVDQFCKEYNVAYSENRGAKWTKCVILDQNLTCHGEFLPLAYTYSLGREREKLEDDCFQT